MKVTPTFIARVTGGSAVMRAWRERLSSRLTPLRQRWLMLPQRDRHLVVLMTVVVLAAAMWLLFIKPARDTIRFWDDELPRLRSQAHALKDLLADMGPITVGATEGRQDAQQAMQAVQQSLETAGLSSVCSVQAAGAGVAIEFKPSADLPKAMAWALQAPPALRMTVSQLSLQRLEEGAAGTGGGGVRMTVTVATQ